MAPPEPLCVGIVARVGDSSRCPKLRRQLWSRSTQPLKGDHTDGPAKPVPWCVLAWCHGAPSVQFIGELI
jgi:hypothetical protein